MYWHLKGLSLAQRRAGPEMHRRTACGSEGSRADRRARKRLREDRFFTRGIRTGKSNGAKPLPTRQRKSFCPTARSRVKEIKRASRGRSPQTVREDTLLPTAKIARRPPKRGATCAADSPRKGKWGRVPHNWATQNQNKTTPDKRPHNTLKSLSQFAQRFVK